MNKNLAASPSNFAGNERADTLAKETENNQTITAAQPHLPLQSGFWYI
jgi:hypothetical protein